MSTIIYGLFLECVKAVENLSISTKTRAYLDNMDGGLLKHADVVGWLWQ